MGSPVFDDFAFSELAYDLTEGDPPTVPVPPGFVPLEVEADPTGVNAVAFIDTVDQQIVIAYRGTDTASSFDLSQDVLLAAGIRPPVFGEAEDFARSLIANPVFAGYSFTVTGHSLGGAEAEDVAATLRLGGVAFGPPGVSNLLPPGIAAGDAQGMTDYVIAGDPIARFASDTGRGPTPSGSHVGTVVTLPSVNDLARSVLGLDLVGLDVHTPEQVLVTAVLTEHFLPFYGEALAAQGIIPDNPLALPAHPFSRLVEAYQQVFPPGAAADLVGFADTAGRGGSDLSGLAEHRAGVVAAATHLDPGHFG